ncbi:MAG: hypothetical protein KGH57_02615 [Candidatus Micrarchaeota archaeon]|nr:hypothetical protein [Candidatus Micrarchaeota archaeon]
MVVVLGDMGFGERIRSAAGKQKKGLEVMNAAEVENYLQRIVRLRKEVERRLERNGGAMYDEEIDIYEQIISQTKSLEAVLSPIARDFGSASSGDFKWLESHRPELADRYAGEGILVKNESVVDHDADTISLLKRNDFTKTPGFVLTFFPKKRLA